MPWNDGLIGRQKEIAMSTTSPLHVIAGPGTGKTFGLMRRVARLLETGGTPSRIFVVTFTRAAAIDLKRNLKNLDSPGCPSVYSSTLHSYCFRILNREDVLRQTGRAPRTLLDFERRIMLKDLSLQVTEGIRLLEKRLNAFEAAWARLQSEEPGWAINPDDQKFEIALKGWLHFHDSMLVGELVPLTLNFLRNNPASDELTAFDHVLVDEYQDLNRAEQQLIEYLSSKATLTVIGDDDQSIYSFKFAHPDGIIHFPDTHPGTETKRLDDCIRCPSRIIELANTLIKNNKFRIHRALLPIKKAIEGEIHIIQWKSLEQEAKGLAKIIKAQLDLRHVLPGEIVVLTQRRLIGYRIRDDLKELGIPVRSLFYEESLGNSLAQERFAILTLLSQPNDLVAWRVALGFGAPDWKVKPFGRIREWCETHNIGLLECLGELDKGQISIPHTNTILGQYRKIVEELKTLQRIELSELISKWLGPENEKTAILREMASAIIPHVKSVDDLLDEMRTNISQPEIPEEATEVRIMSLHKSKGLSAKMVVVAGCIEGVIPGVSESIDPAEKERHMEEQRRLLYVAITRTKQYLFLSSSTSLATGQALQMGAIPASKGIRTKTSASRFLAEIGPRAPKPILGENLLMELTAKVETKNINL